MITRTTTIDVRLTPREVESEIWEMYSPQQADLILAMTQRYKNQTGDVLYQLKSISDEVLDLLSKEERSDAIHLFEEIVDYLKGTEE